MTRHRIYRTALAAAALAATAALAAASPAPAAPNVLGLDGQIYDGGPTSLGIIANWSSPGNYAVVIQPGQWSSAKIVDADGYYIGAGYGAAEYDCQPDLNCSGTKGNWKFRQYVGVGRHPIAGGLVRTKVVAYRLGTVAPR